MLHELAARFALPSASSESLLEPEPGKRCATCPERLATAPRAISVRTVAPGPNGQLVEEVTDLCVRCFAAALREYGYLQGQASRSAVVPMLVAAWVGLAIGGGLGYAARWFLGP